MAVKACARCAVVKLLDFGIAKLLHPDAAEAGLTSGVGTRLGMSYTMAPEQIRGDRSTSAPTSTRSASCSITC